MAITDIPYRFNTSLNPAIARISQMMEDSVKPQASIAEQRQEAFDQRCKEITQQRLATQMSTGRRMKKLSPAERLSIRIQIHRQISEN